MIYPQGFKTIVREHKDWTFHAAEVTRNGMQVVYGRSRGKDGKVNETLETYSGPNYIPGSTGKSYSRKYEMTNIPDIHSTTKFLLEAFLKQELGSKLLKI
jgi:NADPH-dependent glutamate synthase beta subunit-like oxidoreductase